MGKTPDAEGQHLTFYDQYTFSPEKFKKNDKIFDFCAVCIWWG